jgi:uncharacterized membrane protein (UPF0127 family)
MRVHTYLVMMAGIFLLGCSPPAELPRSASEPTQLPTKASIDVTKPGQTLPISAKAIIAGQVIQLEVAQTPQQQEIGLMNRTTLADDHGMLFQFSELQAVSFWMKNTLIPLDIVFLRDGVVKAIALNVPPCTSDPCPVYGSGTQINQVIELRGKRTTELGLKVGDRVTIQKVKNASGL